MVMSASLARSTRLAPVAVRAARPEDGPAIDAYVNTHPAGSVFHRSAWAAAAKAAYGYENATLVAFRGDEIAGVFLRDVATVSCDKDSELQFEIELLGVRRPLHVGARSHDAEWILFVVDRTFVPHLRHSQQTAACDFLDPRVQCRKRPTPPTDNGPSRLNQMTFE